LIGPRNFMKTLRRFRSSRAAIDEATSLRAKTRRHAEESRQATALGGGEGTVSSEVPAREEQPRVLLQGMPGEGDLRAREGAKKLQGVRGLEHLRAREAAKQVQGVRGL